ncbi:hypothetical protein OH492_16970 [Vibrio chagasii]|nr:hypothetical protein [Vibrio chagasii]
MVCFFSISCGWFKLLKVVRFSIKADAKSYEGDISVSFIANGNELFKDTEAPYGI